MKQPPCVSNTRISKLMKLLTTLATFKLAVVLVLAFELLPMSDVAPVAMMVENVGPAPAMASALTAGPVNETTAEAPKPAKQKVASQREMPPADWKALRRKEEALARKEQALRELERELDERLKHMTKMEASLKQMLDAADRRKGEKYKHLVDVYANMKSKQAAAALEQLQQEIAVRILGGMRGRQAGEIMSNMSSEKAAVLSEALTRMQLPFGN